MKKLYCVICGKYRKCEKPKTSYLLNKALVISIICIKCRNEDEKLFNPKKAGLCEGSFSWGEVNLIPPPPFQLLNNLFEVYSK